MARFAAPKGTFTVISTCHVISVTLVAQMHGGRGVLARRGLVEAQLEAELACVAHARASRERGKVEMSVDRVAQWLKL